MGLSINSYHKATTSTRFIGSSSPGFTASCSLLNSCWAQGVLGEQPSPAGNVSQLGVVKLQHGRLGQGLHAAKTHCFVLCFVRGLYIGILGPGLSTIFSPSAAGIINSRGLGGHESADLVPGVPALPRGKGVRCLVATKRLPIEGTSCNKPPAHK